MGTGGNTGETIIFFNQDAMQNNDKWVLVSRCLANEASDEEQLTLKRMLHEDPFMQEWYAALERFWKQPVVEDKEAAEQAFQHTWKRIEEANMAKG